MKSLALSLTLVASAAVLSSCGDSSKSAKGLETVEQRASYGIGYNIGQGLSRQPGVKVDQKALQAGIEDALTGAKVRVDEKLIQAALEEVQRKVVADLEVQAKANLQVANDFLAKNKKRSGVKVTASGLQYEVLRKGFGTAKPTATSRVKVHYHGTLADGTVFDSSVQRGQPVELALNNVVPGWTEALQLMVAGDKFKVYLPPSLGYGARTTGKIPPNSALVFEIELLGIN